MLLIHCSSRSTHLGKEMEMFSESHLVSIQLHRICPFVFNLPTACLTYLSDTRSNCKCEPAIHLQSSTDFSYIFFILPSVCVNSHPAWCSQSQTRHGRIFTADNSVQAHSIAVKPTYSLCIFALITDIMEETK